MILVPGTHAAYRGQDHREWWYPGSMVEPHPPSPFVSTVLAPLGFTPTVYRWDTDLDGGPRPPWQWFKTRSFRNWTAWGDAFAERLRSVPYDRRVVIAHSHGGNVMARAAQQVDLRLLVTISSPVRKDLELWYQVARQHIGRWIHVHSDRDRMFRWGSYFDGKFDLFTKHKDQPFADENIYIPKVGHTGILKDPALFHWWTESGLIGFLRECTTCEPKEARDA